MFRNSARVCAFFGLLWCLSSAVAQQSVAALGNTAVPSMINFNGVLKDSNGKSLTGVVGVTFSLYKEAQGGSPLWIETQNVQADKSGRYTVALGSTNSQGVPPDIFASGDARWLGVQVQGQEEQARVLLMSVPYALKALDAETIGGKPASSFMLAPVSSNSTRGRAIPPTGTISGIGQAGFIPVFTSALTIGDSVLFQQATKVGIGTTHPAATLDITGNLSTTGPLSAASYQIGGVTWGSGDSANYNTTVGFRTPQGGQGNTMVGYWAGGNFAGSQNVAVGQGALAINGGEVGNTAIGYGAFDVESGDHSTCVGYFCAIGGDGSLTNATAIGAYASVGQSNSLILGSIGGMNLAPADTNVGIGTQTPQALLHIDHKPPVGVGQDVVLITSGKSGDVASLLLQNTGPGLRLREGVGTDSAYLASSGGLQFIGGDTGTPNHPGRAAMTIDGTGHVSVGTDLPSGIFSVTRNAGAAIADGWNTYSSRRWKTNIATLDDALAKVTKLRGVSYDVQGTGKHEIGVIAEEVGDVVPEVVSFEGNHKDARGVDYSRLTALLIEATKEQQRELRHEQTVLRTQAAAIRNLTSELRATRQTLERVKAQLGTATLAAAK